MIDAAPRTRAVLFDLDGTLADTAPDLGAAVNRLRVERGLAELPLAHYRPWASAGARGLLRAGFGLAPGDPDYEPLREAFLERYARGVCVHTRLFPGNLELIVALGGRGVAWGIVTNKATRFTSAIVAALGIKPDCVVCGDTTPHIKPHPAPLLHAVGELNLEPRECCYVGDDLRDVQAARAAGMRVVAVEYGYCGDTSPHSWNADAVISRPLELLEYL
jgi:phosphoglycolate phosphatase